MRSGACSKGRQGAVEGRSNGAFEGRRHKQRHPAAHTAKGLGSGPVFADHALGRKPTSIRSLASDGILGLGGVTFPPTRSPLSSQTQLNRKLGWWLPEAALGEVLGFVDLLSNRSFEHLYHMPPPFAQMIKHLPFLLNQDGLGFAAVVQGPASQRLMTSKGYFPLTLYIYRFFWGG